MDDREKVKERERRDGVRERKKIRRVIERAEKINRHGGRRRVLRDGGK